MAEGTSCPPGSPQQRDRRAAPGGAGNSLSLPVGSSSLPQSHLGGESRGRPSRRDKLRESRRAEREKGREEKAAESG